MTVRKFSAGGVVFKRRGKNMLWLIRRPAPNPGFDGDLGWNLPRGLIDNDEPLETAAIREVAEETGVQAKIIGKLPTFKIFFTDKETGDKVLKFITIFLMEWEKDLPGGFGWETAEIKWAEFDAAEILLAFTNEKNILRQAIKLVDK